MFEALIFVAAGIAILGAIIAFDGSRDVFHPLIFIGPMLAFLYGWMPFKLWQADGLNRYFDGDQLRFVQTLNVLGVLAFVVACLLVGTRVRRPARVGARLSLLTSQRLVIGGGIVGCLGLLCWMITIINVGGIRAAFSTSYSGGWDSSGYIRDGSMLMLVGVLFALTVISAGGPRLVALIEVGLFGIPWMLSAVFMGRRGPTFMFVVICAMGWYFNRSKRPPLVAIAVGGVCLGWLVLFLVTNRSNLYIGSDFQMSDNVDKIVDTPDTGNEFIYGTGTVIGARKRDHYFWMRRYLAQVLIRPIPSAIWPTKYEDFGVPELLYNGGTDAGIGDALGWVGAPGSAPGIVGDLWVEVWWFAIAAMALLGWAYGTVWKKAVMRGGPWTSQFIIISSLALYMVMQTMEAVIFRTLMLSIPAWIVWRWAQSPVRAKVRPRLIAGRLVSRPRQRHVRPGLEGAVSSVGVRHV